MKNFADLEKEWKENDDPEKGVVIFIPEDKKLIRAVFGDGVIQLQFLMTTSTLQFTI